MTPVLGSGKGSRGFSKGSTQSANAGSAGSSGGHGSTGSFTSNSAGKARGWKERFFRGSFGGSSDGPSAAAANAAADAVMAQAATSSGRRVLARRATGNAERAGAERERSGGQDDGADSSDYLYGLGQGDLGLVKDRLGGMDPFAHAHDAWQHDNDGGGI
eukprot:TRINITY_DN4083_c0_g3_i1.p1 TRINITY_DN4083_c0_g3~~TRINITY_DN4083_c0_g3_i1.p1  ORF type:complete len:178 (-),score=16.71 TRINITY_DN4083_c0_g3_i1:487-966(-)